MESRVSTAPGPKAKRWPKNPGSSHLLRNVKSLKGDSSFLEASAEENRPQTCPALTLTPRLHWNLNNSALNMLPKRQVEELYGLFKFYDSSTIGDALPSINCTRFMEILRDAGLLRSDNNDTGTSSTVPLMEGLWAKNVEKIFAQAAMGKMRVYLDADDQPALTFSLFCGAIMNCAMLLIPSEHPVNALYQILPTLLECSLGNEHHASAAKGLLGHLPTDGSLSCWIPGRSHASLPRPEDAQQDFRDLPSFQQVIADCESDKVFEELRKEEMAKRYQVPDRLLASFEHDTIALISDKFRLFDVSERGVLPRHEIFALLSGLGKRADLPDPYSVLPRLFASKNPMETNQSSAGITSGCEMTLAELLEAVEVTREAKRHSSAARLASIKIHLNRTATTARNSLSFEGSADDNNQSVLDLYDLPEQNKSTTTEGSKDVKERGRRRGVLKSRKSTLSQASDSDVPIRSARASRGSKTHLTHHPSTSNRRKAVLPRRSSSINSNKAETMISATADLLNQVEPECREHSGGKDPTVVEANFLDMNTSNRDEAMKAPSTLQLVPDTDHESQLQCPPSAITIEVYEPPSASNRTTIRIFLLLGGDHDGAICSTISLVFATKEITESEGIYYAAGPNEITRTGPVLPTQKTLTTALRMLKRCVVTRMERGFEQRPAGQLEVVDKMLQDLNKRQPHYSTPIIKSSRETAVIPVCLAKHNFVPASASSTAQRFGTARHISSAPSDHVRRFPSRQTKLPPHSKNQNKLPSNYRDLFTTWPVSGSDKWVHDVNAASPLKPALYLHNQATPCRSGHLSPLRFPSRENNHIKNTHEL